jgi:hypothetical protein
VDPVSLVLNALASGAAQGATDSASDAAGGAYAKLAQLVTARLSGSTPAEVALAEYAADPQTWRAPLAKALAACGAGGDRAIIEAAQELMGLLDQAGSKHAGRQADLRGAHGVQLGDGNLQFNTFNSIRSTLAMPSPPAYVPVRPTLNPPADERHHISLAETPRTNLPFPQPEADVPQASPVGDSASIPAPVAKEDNEALLKAAFEEWTRPTDPSS